MRLSIVITALLALASLALSPTWVNPLVLPSAAGAPRRAAGPTTARTTAPVTSASTVTTTTPAPSTATLAIAATAAPPQPVPVLPSGTGMWIWQPGGVEDGNVTATAARAKQMGLSHLFVRTGSSWNGNVNAEYLMALLPLAHSAGLRVYGWDFPNLNDLAADLERAMNAIMFVTPDGHRLDGFSPDIETPSEGVNLTSELAGAYSSTLRRYAGPHYPLIATVPRPSPWISSFYPWDEVIGPMDAVAPMVYWLDRQPDSDVADALQQLAHFGKPVMPIGQAYDGSPEGGRAGNPTYEEIQRFISTAKQYGAASVSFWSWQHASIDNWAAIQQSAFSQFVIAPSGLAPVTLPPPIG